LKERHNQKIYELIQFSSFPPYIYTQKTGKVPENQFSNGIKNEPLQTLDSVEFSSFPDPSQKTGKVPENQFSKSIEKEGGVWKTHNVSINDSGGGKG